MQARVEAAFDGVVMGADPSVDLSPEAEARRLELFSRSLPSRMSRASYGSLIAPDCFRLLPIASECFRVLLIASECF